MAPTCEAGVAVVRRATDVDIDWVLPPPHRLPVRSSVTDRFTIGVLWPRASSPDFDVADLDDHERYGRAVEEAGVDFVLISDGYEGGMGADRRSVLRSMVSAVPIITATSRLGVVTTLRTTFLHPTQIARMGAHLDWLSVGRWGWSVATGSGDREAALYGMAACPALDERYAIADESVRAVLAVWGGGADGIEFEGQFFRISGRAKRPQAIQRPAPLLVGSGSSRAGRDLVGRHLDAWITTSDEPAVWHAAREQFARLRPPDRGPVRCVQHIQLRSAASDRSTVNGADRAITEHLEQRSEVLGGIDGLLIELDEWSPDAVRALADAVHDLEAVGRLVPLAERTSTW